MQMDLKRLCESVGIHSYGGQDTNQTTLGFASVRITLYCCANWRVCLKMPAEYMQLPFDPPGLYFLRETLPEPAGFYGH